MVILVLPAFNEGEAIVPLLTRVREFVRRRGVEVKVIVVDDGSKDDTAARAEAFQGLPVEVIRHGVNRGLSAGMRTGLSAAVARCGPDDVIVTMDADDTHIPALMGQMLDRIAEGYNLVIASRYRQDSRMLGLSRWRAFLSMGAGWLFRFTFPIEGVRDYTCGYRAYEAWLLQEAFARWGDDFIDQPGFSCMVDILLKVSKLRPVVVEVPLLLRYDRKPGLSKMNVRRTITQTLALMVRRRLSLKLPPLPATGKTTKIAA
jgi:dolichol-phosphate mannosyltransferase